MSRCILSIALCCAVALTATRQTKAGFTMLAEEKDGDVIFSGEGALDLSTLTFLSSNVFPASTIEPRIAGIFSSHGAFDIYGEISGPSNFGNGGKPFGQSDSGGDVVGLDGSTQRLFVPAGYVSGSFLTSSSTYNGSTFESLGVVLGEYTWTWGSGANEDFFQLSVVPEPTTYALALIGLCLIGRLHREPAAVTTTVQRAIAILLRCDPRST